MADEFHKCFVRYRHIEDGALVVLKEFDLAGLTTKRDAATGNVWRESP